MPEYTINEVVNPWQVLVICVIAFIVLGLPQILAWLNSRKAKTHAKDAAEEIRHQSNPNSGKSLKDALNRIEASLAEQDKRLEKLERGRPFWRR
jgi:Sec-independent protein translocase protein TatA